MTHVGNGLVAQTRVHDYYEVATLSAMHQWWHWLALVSVCLAIAAYVILLYRRDTVELRGPTRWGLLILRLFALSGLLIFFLNIEKRSEQQIPNHSRTCLLIDTSQSMGLSDLSADRTNTTAPTGNRLEQVIESFESSSLLNGLREMHDVVVYRFDQSDRPTPLATFPKQEQTSVPTEVGDSTASGAIREARTMYGIAAGLGAIALLALLVRFLSADAPRWSTGQAWGQLAAVLMLIVGLVTASVANLRNPSIDWQQLVHGRIPAPPDAAVIPTTNPGPQTTAARPMNWSDVLRPSGVRTHLGDAIRYLVDKERGGPIAGIVVITDGNGNAGVNYQQAIDLAQDAGIPVYTVGMGSAKSPRDVRVVDLDAPPRVYPGDMFNVVGYVQASGLNGRSVKVQLTSRPESSDNDADAVVEQEKRLTLRDDGRVQSVEFQVAPDEEGVRVFGVRVQPPDGVPGGASKHKSTRIQIVNRRNRVLLLASGPTREYRFVRNLLFRDQFVSVDVLLQGRPPGIAQEADTILDRFPTSANELFQYDAIISFDPDWSQLNSQQVELLERWVSEKAGGLVMIAGPIHTEEWATLRRSDPRSETILALFPVVFPSRAQAALAGQGRKADTAWGLRFEKDGKRARFLWLGSDPVSSESAWSSFAGVTSFQPVRGHKPAATVYARFSDPTAAAGGEAPIYLAEQFYGAGRVFYIGSGEMWRLRATDDSLHEMFYTQLVRHVSQGRLLRDSSRGVLLVSQPRCVLGDTVTIRASLSDPQYRPLQQESVDAMIVSPDEARIPLTLKNVRETQRGGVFSGQFTARMEGDYRIELPIPQSPEFEVLQRQVKVRIPQKEIENPQRNDAVLAEIASATGGAYYVGMPALMGQGGTTPLVGNITPNDQETVLPGAPDPAFERRLMTWLLFGICGALCLEWLLRRVGKLA